MGSGNLTNLILLFFLSRNVRQPITQTLKVTKATVVLTIPGRFSSCLLQTVLIIVSIFHITREKLPAYV